MKYLRITFLFTLAVSISCQMSTSKRTSTKNPSKVEIKTVDGHSNFYVNGNLFELKGAGGGNNLFALHEAGGNSIRTWSSDKGEQLLDSAAKYNIMVAMGLRMGQELHHFDYNDAEAVSKQYQRNIAQVEKLKNHPNLLCWVVGNELNLSPNQNTPVNPKVYNALKDLVDYIHQADPNHPVTTTFAGISKEQIHAALDRCPDLDFLSLQVYGDLGRLTELVQNAEITKPFAITEYGPIGHWEGSKTEWGREIEETSAVKASGIYDRIREEIVGNPNGLCLGGYAFLWGQKQERTPTWYGMFLKSGEATAIVDELTRYWTGKYPDNRAPKLDAMKINNQNAVENIRLKPGTKYTAQVFVSDPDGDTLTYKWEILNEVVKRSEGGAHEKEPGTIQFKTLSDENGELLFISPTEPGEYRLFSYVFDGKNKAGTANVPFCVE